MINLVGDNMKSFEHEGLRKYILIIELLKIIRSGHNIIFGKDSINLVCVEKVVLKIFLEFYRIVRIVPIYYFIGDLCFMFYVHFKIYLLCFLSIVYDPICHFMSED